MSTRVQGSWVVVSSLVLLAMPAVAWGQQPSSPPAGRNMAEMKFGPVPGLPTCAPGSVQSGDPTKGPSVIAANGAAGCSIPWHWHSPNEHLMIVSGVVQLRATDGQPLILRAGGFAMMPSRHVHQFRGITACALFVYSDAAFDIHYVDTTGKDLSPDEALKAVHETVARQKP